jgi:hypothetical protein
MAATVRLWIGGSSCLTRTYQNAYFGNEKWILLGREAVAPAWLDKDRHCYIPCDLTLRNILDGSGPGKGNVLLTDVLKQLSDAVVTLGGTTIGQIVVGIRPPLVTVRSNVAAGIYGYALLLGLRELLEAVLKQHSVDMILHVSSIAAVDHIQKQHLRSVNATDPPSSTLQQPYDRFKRGCEELVEQLCTSNNIRYSSLRFGAIFSDDPACIQCSSLALQCYTGPYLRTKIDCNSSRNAAHLIRLILQQSHKQKLRPIYYYTRCVSQYPMPVPYGEFLIAYRRAYGLDWLPMLVPILLVEWCVVRPLHWLTVLLTTVLGFASIPILESVDYLLQVTLDEHTFDMTETVHDFPEILQVEESMEECFRRRRALLVSTSSKIKDNKV